MIPEKSLVIYKNRPAIAAGFEAEKICITVFRGGSFKVREKDIELLHPGPCAMSDLEESAPVSAAEVRQGRGSHTEGNGGEAARDAARDAWELLASDDAAGGIPLKELAELVYGSFSPCTAWAAYELLREGLYFTGDMASLRARPRAEVEEDEKKREEKQRETGDRAAFIQKLKKLPSFKGGVLSDLAPGDKLSGDSSYSDLLSPVDRRFLQDVEALARGQTGKSRTLKELGKSETPVEAHRLLLAAGAWTVWENPYPARFGLSRDSAAAIPPPPPEEERLDLTGMAAYAIDNPWSDDPDDAVSLEGPDAEGRYCLWVHVADPASSIIPESPADIEARDRGATLYLPEGPSRMLSPNALSLFVLGGRRAAAEAGSESGDVSPALSFKIILKQDLSIGEIDIIPSLLRVTRLSYEEADGLIAAAESGKGGNAGTALAALAALAERNVERRLDTGAVVIDFPDAHIHVKLGDQGESGSSFAVNSISVEPIGSYRSADMVRECMIWAGEGAARWALQKQAPFPFISQEAGELPGKRLSGFAGAWQLRRCMRPRSLSAKPGVHWGLGLDAYTQVTSPLRRYTDLICHQQIRAVLRGKKPFGEEEVLFRVSAAEAAASAAIRAERASRAHWLAVYLSDKKGSVWEGVVLDRKAHKGTVIIPGLGLETQISLRGNEELNDTVRLSLLSVKIPEGEVGFGIHNS